MQLADTTRCTVAYSLHMHAVPLVALPGGKKKLSTVNAMQRNIFIWITENFKNAFVDYISITKISSCDNRLMLVQKAIW